MAGTVLLVATLVAVRAWPAQDSDVSAAALLAEVEAGAHHPYSGYVESLGTLQLPTADRFTDVGQLFGEKTRMRVWWRSSDAWRVDKLLTTGEQDLVHNAQGTTRWRYEQADATVSNDPAIRLPRTADLVPPAVARLLLDDMDESEVRRLPARRVAGVDAPGLRLQPAAPQSSIDHVDIWADPASGVALRVEVTGKGATKPAFTTTFESFDAATPSQERTTFTPPPGAEYRFDDVLDIADAANQFAPFVVPDRVAGLTKSPQATGAVGIYGSGVTRLLAVPLRHQEAGPLREQLLKTLGVVAGDDATQVTVGPLNVLLTGREGDGGWLLAGTVTTDTLTRAAADLARGVVVVDGR
ncbi:MAG: hypothetical protein ABIO16_00415 [Nocardioides sp.]